MNISHNAPGTRGLYVVCVFSSLLAISALLAVAWDVSRSRSPAEPGVAASVSARQFVLVNSNGRRAAVLGFSGEDDQEARLTFLGAKGEKRLEVGLWSGASPGLALYDGDECIADFSLDEYQRPSLDFFQKGNRRPIAETGGLSLYLNAQALPSLRFLDKEAGHTRLWLFLDDEKQGRPQLNLDDKFYDLAPPSPLIRGQ